jgi:hypothetical protein
VKGLEPTPSTTTKKGRKKQRGIPCSWIGRLNVGKMSVLPNMICRLNTIPASYFGILTCWFKIFRGIERPGIAKTTLKKNKVGASMSPNLKTNYEATVTNRVILANKKKNRSMEQKKGSNNKLISIQQGNYILLDKCVEKK